MKKTKRTLAILLAICMVMALTPLTASAEGTEVSTQIDLITAVGNGGAVMLGADITLTQQLVIDKAVTLDLNGKTVTVNGVAKAIQLKSGGKLTVTDTGAGGKITSNDDRLFWVSGGELDLVKGSFESTCDISKQPDIVAVVSSATNIANYSVFTLRADATLKYMGTPAGSEDVYGFDILRAYRNNDDTLTGSANRVNDCYGAVVNIYGKIENVMTGGYINGNCQKVASNVATITIHDGAEITGVDGANSFGIYAAGYAEWTVNKAAITANNGIGIKAGKLNINGATLIATGDDTTPTQGYSNGINASGAALQIESNDSYVNGMEINISGDDTVITSDKGYSIYEYLDSGNSDTQVGSIEISGGTFTGAICISSQLAAKDPAVFEVSGGTFNDLSWVPYAAANANVKLGDNVTLTSTISTDKNLTIDLNGHNITGDDCRVFLVNSGTLTLDGTGTISSTHDDGSLVNNGSVIRVSGDNSSPAKLIVKSGVTVSSPFCYAVSLFGTTSKQALDLYGTLSTTGDRPALSGNGGDTMLDGMDAVTINIYEGATVTSQNTAAIYHSQVGTLNIYGGTITGTTGIYVKSGTINISGGTITGNGPFNAAVFQPAYPAAYTGDALYIELGGFNKGDPIVNISGGVLNSANGYALQECKTKVDFTTQAELSITDGKFKGASGKSILVDAVTDFVSGGKYSAAVVSAYLASGYSGLTNTGADKNEYPIVVKATPAASIGDGADIVYYDTLAAAVNAAATGRNTITLMKDNAEAIKISKALIIIRGAFEATGLTAGDSFEIVEPTDTQYEFKAKDAIEVIVTETVDVTPVVAGGSIEAAGVDKINAVIMNTEVVGVADAIPETSMEALVTEALGAITPAETSTVQVDIKVEVAITESDLTNGILTFTAEPKADIIEIDSSGASTTLATGVDVDNKYLDKSNITVKLPLPAGFSPVEIIHVRKDDSRVRLTFSNTPASGKFVIVSESGNSFAEFTITEFSSFEAYVTPTVVAQIGNTTYSTLQEAINAASSGNTIELQKDCTEAISVGGKSLTIVRGAYSYDANKVTVGANCTKTDDAGNIVIAYSPPPAAAGRAADLALSFDTNGGSKLDNVYKAKGTKIDLKDYAPTRDGFVFAGWYADKALTKPIDEVALDLNTTVYAKWTEPERVNPFSDVSETDWFYNDVLTAYEDGLVNGRTADSFAPTGSITLAETIKLAACMNQLDADGAVTLVNGTPVWYSTYVDYALAKGIISQGQFDDYDAIATRAQFAEIFASALPEAEYAEINSLNDGDIPDVALSDSYGPAVYRLYQAGALKGNDDLLTFAPDRDIQRSEVAAIVNRMTHPENRVVIN